MIQLKAIFSVLLRDWTFELAQPPGTYRNDHSKMVVQLAQPCVVRYRRRAAPIAPGQRMMRIEVDLDLCQGHAMCELEAPAVFAVPPQRQGQCDSSRSAGEPRATAVEAAVRYCPTQALKMLDD